MTRKEKARFVADTLQKLFPQPDIPLHHADGYTLLIAVVLSAQCTDERVNKITPHLFKSADNPFKMIKLNIEKIQDIIRPCGLSPAKSKAIFNLSKILVEKYNGRVPSTFEELESLPGVGHKTASVVMSQVFGVSAFPVDTHIHRLAKRWGLSSGKSVTQTEKDLKKIFSEETWNTLHLQIIYFGRTYCKARGHEISACPICRVVNKKGAN
ncbi:MAG: endonuclease III [Fimbriimonadaceae bacterium]|nr:endonuclease III [Chitinophagales bacterium]